MPPGFWEIYDQQTSCGLTIHFVAERLDAGDVVAEQTIPIHPKDTPATLRQRLDSAAVGLLAAAVRDIAGGAAARIKQPAYSKRPRTRPTRKQIRELARRAPHLASLEPTSLRSLGKTVVYLAIYFSGLLHFARALRHRSRACILLYHRIEQQSHDSLTTSLRRFAEHLCLLKKYFNVTSTEWIVDQLKDGKPIRPTAVAIHFDDCYESVFSKAAPLLEAAGIPAMSFISSGFLDTDRKFPHDEAKYPLAFANLTRDQARKLPEYGVTIGSHTVNHTHMGEAYPVQAKSELVESRAQLERITGRSIAFFSFPYGRKRHFRDEYASIAREAGYEAIFSAYGGFISKETPLYDLPRLGVGELHRPIDLLMDIEGFGNIAR
jgi:peptidoglycan/xylan/chitin deacetylase (PgdA/CDA1 family)